MTENPDIPIISALYIRVSTTEQAEHGYSIDAQEQALRQYCEANNRIVYKVYCDRGISGSSTEKRYELQRMRNDAKHGLFNEVLVWKTNRLARRNLDLLQIVEDLTNQQIGFRSITENKYDTTTPQGIFQLQIMGAVSELDRNNILENAKMGLKQRARTGKHNARAPIGYKVVILSQSSRKRDTRIEIVPEEAALVQRIFDQFASGRGLRSIANSLNSDGHRTKRGNPFSICAISDILDNPFYVGKIQYLKFQDWSKMRRKGKNGHPIVADGIHEPIINDDLWQKVKFLRRQKSVVSEKRFHGDLLLTGLIRCPACGAAMTGSRTNNKDKQGNLVPRFYYSCSTMRSKGAVICKANSIRKHDAETYIFDRLKEVLIKPHILRGIVKGINDRKSGNVKPLQDELETVKIRIDEIQAKKLKIVELYEMDDFDRIMLTNRLKSLESDLDQLCSRKSEIEFMLNDDNTEVITFEAVNALVKRFEDLLKHSNSDQRKTLIHLIVKKITVGENRKIDKIEMLFDEMTEQHFLSVAPSADIQAEGAFPFYGKAPLLKQKLLVVI